MTPALLMTFVVIGCADPQLAIKAVRQQPADGRTSIDQPVPQRATPTSNAADSDLAVRRLSQQIDILQQRCDSIHRRLSELADAGRNAPVIPPEAKGLSEQQEQEIAALEQAVEAALDHTPSSQESQTNIERFRRLNGDMAPETQRAAVQRLVGLNWNLAAVDWLARAHDAARATSGDATVFLADNDGLLDEADALLVETLPGANEQLVDRVARQRQEIAGFRQAHRRQALLRRAKKLVDDFDQAPSADLDAAREGFRELHTELEASGLLGAAGDNEQIHGFLITRRRIDVKTVLGQLEAQKQRLEDLTDGPVRQAAVNQLLQSAIALHVRLALEDQADAFRGELQQLARLRTELTAENEAEVKRLVRLQEKQRADYQAWALETVVTVRRCWTVPVVDKRFNVVLDKARDSKQADFAALSHFPSFREWVNRKAHTDFSSRHVSVGNGKKLVNWLGGYWSDDTRRISQRITREAMIKWLLPIDTRLLDQPVAEIYNQTWAELWHSLEGAPQDHRLAVARAAVQTPKVTLDNFRK
jgi:hypothetical protein